MRVNFKGFDFVDGGICAPAGFQAAGIHCGIRKNKDKRDLALIYSEDICTAAAIYTQNKVKGAPIAVTKKNIKNGKAQAIIVNSGNANTCNADGEQKAQMMCDLTAKALGINQQDVIVASTGVIGQVLDIEPIQDGMPQLVSELSDGGSNNAAEAIMTTDTVKKEIAVEFHMGDAVCKIAGIAKGSGMIHPNMATMLCFITTDVAIEAELLQSALKKVADDTFNMVSIDGDTSTNDMACVLASGKAGNPLIDKQDNNYEIFINALYVVLMNLSREIAADGEGATKLLECHVTGADDEQTAKKVAKSVITSSLFKSAMFGADANWGRILCAIGYADAEFNIGEVSVQLASAKGCIRVCEYGAGVDFSEETAKEILLEDEIIIIVSLGKGKYSAVAWGCDLTYDYVKINGDYRT